jgi:hypothetical protein
VSTAAHLIEEGVAAVLLPGLPKGGGVRAGARHEGAPCIGGLLLLRLLLLLLLHRAAAQRAAAHDAQAAAACMAGGSKGLHMQARSTVWQCPVSLAGAV